MTESESVALPLGDAAIFSTSVIIADSFAFVNTKMKIFLKSFFFFQYAVKVLCLFVLTSVFAEFDEEFLYARGCKKKMIMI